MNKILIASDHAGLRLKEKLKLFLRQEGFGIKDFGTHSEESCDYPDYAIPLARQVGENKKLRGILICKSGIGNSIVANRFAGVRAALCYNKLAARLSRQHNDSNILVLGAGFVSTAQAKSIVRVWLDTEFEGGRHMRRLEKIDNIAKHNGSCGCR